MGFSDEKMTGHLFGPQKGGQVNPRTYKQPHTSIVVQQWGEGGGWWMPPWVFVMLQYFERISPLVESLWHALQDKRGLLRYQMWPPSWISPILRICLNYAFLIFFSPKKGEKHPFYFTNGLTTYYLWHCVYNPGQKSWDTFAKTPQIRAFPLHPLCNVDLKGPSHPESLQALSHCLGVEGGRQWPKQCDINRAADLRKAFFTNVQFCVCFCRVSQVFARIVITITTDAHQSCIKMCARDMHTATENGRGRW